MEPELTIYHKARKCLLAALVGLSPILFTNDIAHAQEPQVILLPSASLGTLAMLKKEYGQHKIIPATIEEQVLLALSYFPELKNTKIIFRIRPAHSPLSARPAFTSIILDAANRKYIITISDHVSGLLSPILFQRLPFNAQVGVLGHELSHVADFSKMNSFQLLGNGLRHISSKYIDRFEYRTDSICIAHGLGFQLLAWSVFVRNALNVKEWHGADDKLPSSKKGERYMNPGTIVEYMRRDGFYGAFMFNGRD